MEHVLSHLEALTSAMLEVRLASQHPNPYQTEEWFWAATHRAEILKKLADIGIERELLHAHIERTNRYLDKYIAGLALTPAEITVLPVQEPTEQIFHEAA
jgi:hypothetical protein